jgi:xanthine dehydrogenase accessory factor
VVNLWPEQAFKELKITTNTAVAILTHDDKIDLPAIQAALDSEAFYIGALGSKKTQARRKTALLNQGVASTKLEKIHGPIGIDIGAESPSEIALAIMAEITAAGNNFKVQSQVEF